MSKHFTIITNNPLVEETLSNEYQIEYFDESYEEILKRVRDRVFAGQALLSHPLSGSVKPNETPYKSVMVADEKGSLDIQSVQIIESAIQACQKFVFKSDRYKPEVYEDFQMVDLTLIESAIPSAIAW